MLTLPRSWRKGPHTVSVKVTDGNGKTAQASVAFEVVYPEPTVSIQSPAAGSTVDHTLLHIAGEYTGVADVVVTLMVDDEKVEVTSADNQFSADLDYKLAEGTRTVSVTVKDGNGKTAQASVAFEVVYPEPTVSIQSPAAGSTVDHNLLHIAGEYTGVADVVVTLMVDDEKVEVTSADNQFSADLDYKLAEGTRTVSVKVTDGNGKTAQASVAFEVVYPEPTVSIQSPAAGSTVDHTLLHIAGEYTGVADVVVTLMVDDEKVEVTSADNQFSADLDYKLAEGTRTVSVKVKDGNDKTAQASVAFKVVYPEPTVTLLSPTAGHTYTYSEDYPAPVISGEFTGVKEVEVEVTVAGKNAKVTKDGNQFTAEYPSALGYGTHEVVVKVTDGNEKTAMTSAEFMLDMPAPTVAILSPAPGQTYGNGEAAVIRVEYAGMDASVTSFTINGDDVEVEVEPEDTMFMHTPEGLTTGEYVVAVEVTDAANNKKAMDTVVFNVKLDDTPPVIAEVAPSGILNDTWVNISVAVSDDQSDITAVDFFIRNEADTHKGFLPLGTVIAGSQNSATKQQIADGNILDARKFR